MEQSSTDIFGTTHKLISMVKRSVIMKRFSIPDNRRTIFGNSIHENNHVESIRIHETYIDGDNEYICQKHKDINNSKEIKMVMWWSKKVHEKGLYKRLGMVLYWKTSIDQYMIQHSIHEKYLQYAITLLEQIDTKRYMFYNLNLNKE